MAILCVIPARGGSKGLPGKNIADLLGRPVIAYVIDAAFASRRFDRIVVSTEAPSIAAVARDHGVEVVDRPAEYAVDDAPIEPTLRHALRTCESSAAPGTRYDIVVWLQANVPTTRPEIIREVIDKMESSGADSVATVLPYAKPPQWAWRLEGDRMVKWEGLHRITATRQAAVQAFHYDGSVIGIRRDLLLDSEGTELQSYLGTDRRCVVQSHDDTIEIDTPFDHAIAELILRRRGRGAAA